MGELPVAHSGAGAHIGGAMDTIHHITSFLGRLKPLIEEMQREAYQRGWDDAIAHVIAAAKGGGHATMPTPAKSPRKRRDMPVSELLLELITANPGARGTELVDHVMAERPGANRRSIDRTARTALLRMKKRGVIESREGHWYSTKEAA